MEVFKKLLKELEEYMLLNNFPICNTLNDGIVDFNVKSNSEPYFLPESLATLYSWKNGTLTDNKMPMGSYWLFEAGIFMEFKEALATQSIFTLKQNDDGWDVSKFPVFKSGGGEYFLIDCDPKSSTYEMIFQHSIGSLDFDLIITQYDSLYALFLTIYECFKLKAYYYDEANILAADADKADAISKKNNPKSDFWKLFD